MGYEHSLNCLNSTIFLFICNQAPIFELSQIWDVLSNKEVVDIVASASARSSAARKLVESAVRAWRSKYPTSKIDDCAVVCLFLDKNENHVFTSSAHSCKEHSELSAEKEGLLSPMGLNRSGTVRCDSTILEEGNGESAEGTSEYEEMNVAEAGKEWSALEGVSRVNTMVTLPRYVPTKEDKKAAAAELKKRK